MNKRLAFILILSLSKPAFAVVDLGFAKEDGGQAGGFLEYAGSARSMSMGGAATAVSDDASATLTNPAGLAQIQRKDIVTSYSSLFANTEFGVFNYAQPTVDYGTFGVGLVSLQSKDFERRDTNQQELGTFSTSEMAVLLSHGFEWKDRFSLGSSLKIIREEVASFSGTGYGLDGGAQMRFSPAVNLGIVVRNILAPRLKLRNEKDRYPLDVRAGAEWLASRKLTMALDLDKTAGRSPKPYFGGEWTCNPSLVLRGGISEKEITTGIGIRLKDWGLDYAFAYQDAASGLVDLGTSHRFGFHMNFGGRVFEQEVSTRWQKKGQAVLVQLRSKMNEANPSPAEVETILDETRQIIRRQGFLSATDLYAAQGYVSYFTGEFERSAQSLGEALALDPQNIELSQHLEKARTQLSEEKTREIVTTEVRRMKELYEKADWQGTLKSCDKVLTFRPDDADALTYRDEARKRISEPIEREMKIAKLKFERGEYLDSIKGLQHVKEMDPQNQEASVIISSAIAALELQAASGDVVQEKTAAAPAVYEIPRNVGESRALYSKGLELYSQGNLKEAALMWERAVQFDTKNVLARNAYNRAQFEMRDSH